MEKNGLNNNSFDVKFILTSAVKFYQAAESDSSDRKQYAKMLKQFSTQITMAIKEKNIHTLLALEKDALEYNYHKAHTEKDKDLCRDALSTLKAIKTEWLQSQDKAFVVETVADAHSGIDAPTKPIKNKAMSSNIDSLSRQIRNIAGRDITPAEDLLYIKRRESLKLVNAEHYKLINKHLGFDMSKQKSRGR